MIRSIWLVLLFFIYSYIAGIGLLTTWETLLKMPIDPVLGGVYALVTGPVFVTLSYLMLKKVQTRPFSVLKTITLYGSSPLYVTVFGYGSLIIPDELRIQIERQYVASVAISSGILLTVLFFYQARLLAIASPKRSSIHSDSS